MVPLDSPVREPRYPERLPRALSMLERRFAASTAVNGLRDEARHPQLAAPSHEQHVSSVQHISHMDMPPPSAVALSLCTAARLPVAAICALVRRWSS